MSDTITKDQTKAAVQMVLAVGDAIKELGSVPSGHLYTRLMPHMTFGSYEKIISLLKSTGLVKEDGFHLLTWIGPK